MALVYQLVLKDGAWLDKLYCQIYLWEYMNYLIWSSEYLSPAKLLNIHLIIAHVPRWGFLFDLFSLSVGWNCFFVLSITVYIVFVLRLPIMIL